jgi:thiamine biosynthesis lipoprotein
MDRGKLILILALLGLTTIKCNSKKEVTYTELSGRAMGTTYSIIVKSNDVTKESIDSLLLSFDNAFSTYNKASFISRFNNSVDTLEWFELSSDKSQWDELFIMSFSLNRELNGAFDPSAAPLFDYWGFGSGKRQELDSSYLDSLRMTCGMDNFEFDQLKIRKNHPSAKLNLNAIAKGYGVDVVSHFLRSKNAMDYMVEIGGEVRTLGFNPNGKKWTIGITKPSMDKSSNELYAIASFTDLSMATSGNYRNYFVEDGQIYGHTIDPRTGYSAKNKLLSATVFASDCATADACATAFMVMGLSETIDWLNDHEGVEAYLIYSEKGNEELKSYTTEGLYSVIKEK